MYKIQLACVTSNHARDLSKLLLITVSVSLHFHILSRHIIFFILEYNFNSLLSLRTEFWASAFNYHSEYKNFLSLNFTLWLKHLLREAEITEQGSFRLILTQKLKEAEIISRTSSSD
ncbi:hypothetical protein MtrunA17_Chr3g0123011 [Medicago truncatula]|uniref:Transmembrane protein n=1 Tax=Medicago truncatula TaxID=3880 RepID=A0A396IY08_MEDTR|nr:hypothetical protein MtrunA17_Chr3g0123011 [Medicago truncatula]